MCGVVVDATRGDPVLMDTTWSDSNESSSRIDQKGRLYEWMLVTHRTSVIQLSHFSCSFVVHHHHRPKTANYVCCMLTIGGGWKSMPWRRSSAVVNWIHSWHIRFNCWKRRGRHQPRDLTRCFFRLDPGGLVFLGLRWNFFVWQWHNWVGGTSLHKISHIAAALKMSLRLIEYLSNGSQFHWISIFNKDQVVDGTFFGRLREESFAPNKLRNETISQSNNYRIFMPSGEGARHSTQLDYLIQR